jgi:hypothetical protein
VSDDHSEGAALAACCGACQTPNHARPRYVIGVFGDVAGANGVADALRASAAGNVNVLSSAVPLMAQYLSGVTAVSLMSCGRLYQQISGHLAAGAAVVIIDGHRSEHQLRISRALLEAKCDVLLTHDGGRHAHDHADAGAD